MDFSAEKCLLPGFRFHPTDVELVMFYLKKKVLGKNLPPEVIATVDIYKFAPWDLPDKSCLRSKDLNWYFFCPREKKYPSGERTKRATEFGFWKATGNDRTVSYKERRVGKIKTLVFHMGKPPKGDRTDWVMHEYRLDDKNLADNGVAQDSYMLCKVYKKSGLGPKNGEQYGAPFAEEEWEDDEQIKGTDCIATMPTCEPSTSAAIATEVGMIVDDVNQVNNAPAGDDGDELERLLSMFDEDNVVAGDNGSHQMSEALGADDDDEWERLLSMFVEDNVFEGDNGSHQVNDAPTVDDDDDLERLRSTIVEDNVVAGDNVGIDNCDAFNGLEDLNGWKAFYDDGFPSSKDDTWFEYCLELQDLEDQFKT